MSGPARVESEVVFTVVGDRYTSKTFEVRRQPSDIDACVPLSILRCAISIISIGLVLTDIPRTGLFLNLASYFPVVGVDTTMYYGPYAYPVTHLNRTNRSDPSSSIAGFSGESRIDGLDVWSYKFDSLSIPTRALAEHLNVSSYPPCLLYRAQCPQPTLDLDTSLTMLNDLIEAVDNRYFTRPALRHLPAAFYTTSNWVDRLHHVVLGRYWYRVDVRLHTVYRFSVRSETALRGINICEQSSVAESHHPLVCKSTVKWLCDHPFRGAQEQIPIADSINLRVDALQQLYPDAELDVTMITTRSELESQRNALLPTIFYLSDNTEITTFIRGRQCRLGEACTTIFLDDYRYERATLETSSDNFHIFMALLRAISQVYVWLRVVLLFYISWCTRLAEPKYRDKTLGQKASAVFLTVAKIPSHLIVYSSWLPIVGYSIAHFADCGLTHIVGDNFWASTQGILSFEFVRYIEVSSIQMRNIWLIALVWKCGISIYNRFFVTRTGSWQPQIGLVTFRGLFIGATSFLTVFTFLRALRFRDSRVLSFHEVQRNRGAANEFLTQRLHKGTPDFGYPVDIKSTTVASVIVVGFVHVARLLSRTTWKGNSRSFFCHTFYVPLSTGVLFPASALSPLWYMKLSPDQETRVTSLGALQRPTVAHIREMSSRILSAVLPLGLGSSRRHCDTCDFVSTVLDWRAIQGCQRHETLFDIGRRSLETQSMVRLTHIGVFSDPIVFFQLRVLGRQLYIYRWRDQNFSADARSERWASASAGTDNTNWTAFLSPVPLLMKRTQSSTTTVHSTRDEREYELLALVNSVRVPWTHLVDCG